ncbi:ABC transporter B family member 1-like [Hibiscus syriacus]|uniref:ABC transporter B family member 1-like n=1 Tax=Hibiscus syriacus TaxID=106335 RepID=A0A6A2YH19_HIBSY|nr:uncharacterized protein LOC120161599 [Hibiscus syriacus]KAE8679386.1 ABC transporter B family member 1-like [Hibiscus syriacus]
MAKTSATFFCSFFPFPSLSLWREPNYSLPNSFRFSNRPSRFIRFSSKASDSGGFVGDDSFGFFPWSPSENDVEWVQEERVTLFTSEGLIQIGGSMIPRRIATSDKKQGKSKASQRLQRFQESNYMDPNQGLCLGALFDIAATNGLDMGRRLCIIGFCRSIEMLSDVVEDTVLEHGGEVVAAEKAIKGGLHEKLTMTVAVPYLWGVPPASDTLHLAVRSGGGIVEKVYCQWDFCK